MKNPVELVLRVKDLAREVGGINQLKQLVDLLAEKRQNPDRPAAK